MFSRFLRSARSIVSPNHPTEPVPPTATAWKPIAIPESIPKVETNSQYKSEHDSTPATKRKAALKQSPKEEATKRKTALKQPLLTVTNPTPRRTRVHSPEMVTTRRQHELGGEELTDENSINVYVPASASAKQSSKKRSIDSIDGVVAEVTPSRDLKKRKTAALPVRSKLSGDTEEGEVDEEDIEQKKPVVEIRVSKEISDDASHSTSKTQHKKFGSDDEGAEESAKFSTAKESQEDVVDAESSDEDEAPEEVGAQTAALTAKAQEQNARSAIESQKKARKERASKVQSKTKRKIETPSPNKHDLENENVSFSEDEVDRPIDESEPEDAVYDIIPTSRRIKYQLDVDKQPRDRKIGPTTFRVTKAQTRHLAPKFSKNARNSKEVLLHARGPKAGANRGQPKKSFL